MPAERRRVAHFLTSRYSESHQNDLIHPIHPIFDFDLWSEPGSRESLEPVLRLASLLLESPASQRFVYSRLYTDHRVIKMCTYTKCRFRRSQAPDDAVERGFREATCYVAKRLGYRWEEFEYNAFGVTHPIPGPNGGSIESCRIELKPSHFPWIHRSPVGPRDGSHIARHRFNLAVTLCHEVAHAIDELAPSQCGHQKRTAHHYFEDQKKSELGFAWEAEVLGYTAECEINYGETTINAARHSSVRYSRQMLALPGRNRPPSPGLSGYIIPIDYIARVQRQIFWDRSRRTMTMLRISTKMEHWICNGEDWVQIVGKDARTGETTVTSLPLTRPVTKQQRTDEQQTGQQRSDEQQTDQQQTDQESIDEQQSDQQQTLRFLGVFIPPKSPE
ncbi:MAG: hypothetical protein LQ349_001276 [Xanthoria aureola]|nr:MAG: hypothetical protein LQ349_001276 [Xanthoria aureola]